MAGRAAAWMNNITAKVFNAHATLRIWSGKPTWPEAKSPRFTNGLVQKSVDPFSGMRKRSMVT
jgi:hypothetical protein